MHEFTKRAVGGRPRRRTPFSNRIIAMILTSPLHSLLDNWLIVIAYRGRRTGRMLSTPVEYVRVGARVIVLVADAPAKQWWRNVRADPAVEVVLDGVRRNGQATVGRPQDAGMAADLRRYLARKPRAAAVAARESSAIVRIDLDPVPAR